MLLSLIVCWLASKVFAEQQMNLDFQITLSTMIKIVVLSWVVYQQGQYRTELAKLAKLQNANSQMFSKLELRQQNIECVHYLQSMLDTRIAHDAMEEEIQRNITHFSNLAISFLQRETELNQTANNKPMRTKSIQDMTDVELQLFTTTTAAVNDAQQELDIIKNRKLEAKHHIEALQGVASRFAERKLILQQQHEKIKLLCINDEAKEGK